MLRTAGVEVWAEHAWSGCFMVCMVYDKVWSDEPFEHKDFGELEVCVACKVCFVEEPLLEEEAVQFGGENMRVLGGHAMVL